MRIAQVSPLMESVPPKWYGGTERIVSYLTEALVRQGHDVTLFAAADSCTTARLRPLCEIALRLDPRVRDPLPHYLLMIEKVLQEADNFDIIHFHCDLFHLVPFRRHRTPTVTTQHGRLDLPDLAPLYREISEFPMVSISDAQRLPLPWLNWLGTVYHGLPPDLLRFQPRPGRYLAFLGRICPDKRPDLAIEIARALGMELKIAAKVDAIDQDYFEHAVKPLLDSSLVEFVGEISEQDKSEFLGNAVALLFPIAWPEPFGLTMIEAMACGTPVVAFRAGSVPEVVDHGASGYIVESCAEAVAAVRSVERLDRRRVRERFEARFTAERMAGDYLAVYSSILDWLRTPLRIA